MALAPEMDAIVSFVALLAAGGLLPTGIVTVAVLDTALLLSFAEKVNVSLPI